MDKQEFTSNVIRCLAQLRFDEVSLAAKVASGEYDMRSPEVSALVKQTQEVIDNGWLDFVDYVITGAQNLRQ